jgi:hypothetical protein
MEAALAGGLRSAGGGYPESQLPPEVAGDRRSLGGKWQLIEQVTWLLKGIFSL